MKTIKLEKKLENGKVQTWEAIINENEITYNWGQLGGKIQEKIQVIKKGKNVGRKNETTPAQQALLEAETKARKKTESGYGIVNGYELTINEKTVLKQVDDAPSPMLAHPIVTYDVEGNVKKDFWPKVVYPCYVQPKLDGIRGTIDSNGNKLASRTKKPIFGMDHILNEVKERDLEGSGITHIDGELFATKTEFQRITSITRTRKNLKSEEELKLIEFHVFDIVTEEPVPFSHRLQMMKDWLGDGKYIKLVETSECKSKEDIEAWHVKFIDECYEGTIVRTTDKPYEFKRSYSLFKYKDHIQEEYEVVGFEKEKGKESLGSVTLISEDGKKFGARPAMSDEAKLEIWDNQDYYMGLMATVRFQEFTDSKEAVPRFPVLIGFRHTDDM